MYGNVLMLGISAESILLNTIMNVLKKMPVRLKFSAVLSVE